MKQNKLKKLFGVCLISFSLIGLFSATVLAADAEYLKNENVYLSLDAKGEANGIYVVNSFSVNKEGEIRDFGDYQEVLNLTNLDPIAIDKDEQKFEAEDGKFYYQGNLEHPELPWNYEITYYLGGREIDPEDLAGEDGDLEICVSIHKNPSYLDDTFFNTYLTQCSITLDALTCKDIVAANANISDAGSDEKITFTLNPATEADLKVAASVTDFEMTNIDITAVPATAVSKSFVSDQNSQMGKTLFIASADGIEIKEANNIPVETVEEKSFFKTFKDQLFKLFE